MQGAIYRIDLADGPEAAEPSLFRRIATKGFSPDDFETEQVGMQAPNSAQTFILADVAYLRAI
jgi:hypothetical protein